MTQRTAVSKVLLGLAVLGMFVFAISIPLSTFNPEYIYLGISGFALAGFAVTAEAAISKAVDLE